MDKSMKKRKYSDTRSTRRVAEMPTTETDPVCHQSTFNTPEDIRLTWMICLHFVNAALDNVLLGNEVRYNLASGMRDLTALRLRLAMISQESPCCLSANINKARIRQYSKKLTQAQPLICTLSNFAFSPDGKDTALSPEVQASLPTLIASLLEAVPSEEELAGVACDFGMAYCLCSTCVQAFMGKPSTMECRHCHHRLTFSATDYSS